ncbi:alpha/beta hydrolase [Amycolatopsis sp. WAC 01376]|uniref:alpha/beta hydrolase n=1 Tax=Amycolatopsis sp. WAC 01376 TaxID=2203195 RepID=UPI000F785866|nr:alpha/beta hydrolase [Amycolatopsis sp. WAC 01376]RSM63206.1 alpha/beta hydrolase [Amycolatopsis sp. WAC 01376]
MAHRFTSPPDAVRVDADVVFARRETGDLLLDLHRPVTGGPVPVVLWLHGGGWFTGDRTLAPDLARHVMATGCAMASIEYRLSSQALFPAQLHDVRAAIRFLRGHAERYRLVPGAVGLWGASAGGHLAALAGLTGHLDEVPGERETGAAPVRAVAASYPPVDLAEVAGPLPGGASSPEARLLGGHPARLPELARQAGPLNWVGAEAPPFQLSHGTGDVLVPHRQSERLHAALVAAGVPSELYLLDGYRHGFLNPPGRLDVTLGGVMDDGRLAAEGTASALRRTSAADGEPAAFGFSDVHGFFRKHLKTRSTTGETR